MYKILPSSFNKTARFPPIISEGDDIRNNAFFPFLLFRISKLTHFSSLEFVHFTPGKIVREGNILFPSDIPSLNIRRDSFVLKDLSGCIWTSQMSSMSLPRARLTRDRTYSLLSLRRHHANTAGPASSLSVCANASEMTDVLGSCCLSFLLNNNMVCGELRSSSLFSNSCRRIGEFSSSLKLLKGALDMGQVQGATCGSGQVSAGVCPWEAVKSWSKSGRCSWRKEINWRELWGAGMSFQDTDL